MHNIIFHQKTLTHKKDMIIYQKDFKMSTKKSTGDRPDGRACFCLNLLSTSVASNPALSQSCRGITCKIIVNPLMTRTNKRDFHSKDGKRVQITYSFQNH